MLNVERPGKFDVRLNFEAGKEDETVQLEIAGVSMRSRVSGGTLSFDFEDIALTAGETELHALLEKQGKRRGVYQVIITRRGDG